MPESTTAPAPAPAAPASAQAAPSTPTPSPSPTPDKAAPSAKSFDALDERVKSKPAEKPPEKKPEDTPPEPEKEPESVKDALAPDSKEGRKVKGDPKELRMSYDRTVKELAEIRGERDTLRSKIAEYDRKGKDTTVLSEQLAAKDKELDGLRSEIRALKQEASPEFKEKYDKPFNSAAEFAKRQVEQLTVTDAEGQQRNAAWKDFTDLYAMPYNAAIAKAKEKFGDAASVVIQHISELQRLDYQRDIALKEEREQASSRQQADRAKQIQEREAVQSMYIKVNEELAAKHPEWYQPDPEDKEGNDLLSEGLALVDYQPATWQEKVVKDSHIRLKAAAFPRMVHRVQQLKNEVDGLKAKLAEYQESEPGKTIKKGGEPAAPAETDWKEDLRKSGLFEK